MTDQALEKREDRTPERTQDEQGMPLYRPRVDITESEKDVSLVADMPGIDESSVTVDLEGNELTIRGTFSPQAPEGYTLMYQEYRSGNYERVFTLGEVIDRDGIEAKVKDGVLRLTLPKSKEAQPKRISVNTG